MKTRFCILPVRRPTAFARATDVISDRATAALEWAAPPLRLVQGVGGGGEMPVAAVCINELSTAHGLGRFFLLYERSFRPA